MIRFILGGNKSGKSDYAMDFVCQSPGSKVFLATGQAQDLAFRKQIASHRERRDPSIPVIEVGWDLPRLLVEATKNYDTVLVDSLDFWLYLCTQGPHEENAVADFLDSLGKCSAGHLVLVSCEIGLTPLPATSEARRFLRKLGSLNQAVAALADEAYLVVAGLPLTLKKADHGHK
jgi:Adenosyl cobinamide kinase/adenosyl cobinamide phosphate guanylyltransferase